jgi:DNA-binding transcriptional LysR family regulator
MERTKRTCQLTTRGRSLLAHSERLFSVATELRMNVAEAGALSGILKIGVVESIALTWLSDLVEEVKRQLPRLELQIDVDLSLALARKLQSRELDIACMVTPGILPGIVTEPLNILDMGWVVRADIPVTDEPLTLDRMCDYPLILHTGSRHAAVITAWLRGTKTTPQYILGCNNLAAITKLTLAGAGISLVPIGAVADQIAAGRLRLVRTRDAMPTNPFFIAYPEEHTDFAVRSMIKMMKDVVARHSQKAGLEKPATPVRRQRAATKTRQQERRTG